MGFLFSILFRPIRVTRGEFIWVKVEVVDLYRLTLRLKFELYFFLRILFGSNELESQNLD